MGFDKNRVTDMSSEELDQFVCLICLEVLTDPVFTQCCRQTYCSECIHNWLSEHNSCPHDRQVLTCDGLKTPPRLVFNFLDQMKVHCVYESNGCQSIVRRSQLSEHEMYCDSKTCGSIRSDLLIGCEHNCIENLLNKNEMIGKKLSKLEVEFNRLKANQSNAIDISDFTEAEQSMITGLILRARQIPRSSNKTTVLKHLGVLIEFGIETNCWTFQPPFPIHNNGVSTDGNSLVSTSAPVDSRATTSGNPRARVNRRKRARN